MRSSKSWQLIRVYKPFAIDLIVNQKKKGYKNIIEYTCDLYKKQENKKNNEGDFDFTF